jgi:hypothetical protein
MSVCQQLESAGVASNCRNATPGGLGAAAAEEAAFDLPSVSDHGGQVLRFDTDDAYDRTVDSFSKAAILSGPHRYGSRKARIFVQMNEGASPEIGAKAKAIVDGLSGDKPASNPATAASSPPPSSAATTGTTAAATSAAASASATTSTTHALDACHKLEAASVAKDCKSLETKPGAPLSDAAGFKFAGWTGHEGLVVYASTDAAYQAMTRSPDGYGSPRARILVEPMKGMPAGVQKQVRAAVDAL